jgi:hypothetical protein
MITNNRAQEAQLVSGAKTVEASLAGHEVYQESARAEQRGKLWLSSEIGTKL